MAAVGYTGLQWALVACNGPQSALAKSVGKDRKGKLSLALYVVAILLAFVEPRASILLYVLVAAVWFVPDSRIEKRAGA